MKRNLLLLAVMVMATLFFTSQSWATCAEQSIDLGICDTLYVETFDCDHLYDTTGIYDSVRVGIYVTHDSNTFFAWPGDPAEKWVQDSIASFVIPLKFWKEGDADSVIFPYGATAGVWKDWNNKMTNAGSPKFKRSMFRHLVKTCVTPPETTFNWFALMYDAGFPDWTPNLDVVSKAGTADTGHVFINMTPMASDCQRWPEGSRVLFATYTFLVYMHPGGKWAKIGIDSTLWPPSGHLGFVRYDTPKYCPRHFLSETDSLYTGVKWIEGSTEEESKPTAFLLSQNYPNPFNPVTNFKLSLPKASHVKMEIFNIVGQRVKTLLDEDMRAGVFVVDWDGKDEKGVEVSSGVYFYRVVAGSFSDIKKMVLLR
jgi:hypothetical protein